MIENRYYDSTLKIDGTADELASFAERYTDDYSDEALAKIIAILHSENKQDKAQRVEFELESRNEVQTNKFDLGRIKLWALDGMYELVDDSRDTYHLNVYSEQGLVIISVSTPNDKTYATSMELERFLRLNSDEFENLVDQCLFYAQ